MHRLIASSLAGLGAVVLATLPAAHAQFLVEDANARDLSAYDVSGLASETHSGPQMVRIARNEIFARRGYRFQSEDLRSWFNAQPWYSPVTGEVELTEQEQRNVRILSRIGEMVDDPRLLFHQVPRDQGYWRATATWSSNQGTRFSDAETLQVFGGPDGARAYVGSDLQTLYRPVEELYYQRRVSNGEALVEPVGRHAYLLDPAYLAGLEMRVLVRTTEVWNGETVTRLTFGNPEQQWDDDASGTIWVTDDGIIVRMAASGLYEPQPGDFAEWHLRFELENLQRLNSYDTALFGWPEVTNNIGAPG